MGRTYAKELTLDEDLGDDDPVAVHALFQFLLHLSVHRHVSFLIVYQQGSQNALHL